MAACGGDGEPVAAPEAAAVLRGPRVAGREQAVQVGRDEPILDADLPIIDAHHHLLVRPGLRYLLDEYLACVHCRKSLGRTGEPVH